MVNEKKLSCNCSGLVKLLYFIYFVFLAGLLFMPSFFASAAGINFTGGEKLIKYFTLLFNEMFKSSVELSATFPLFVSIKWIFYSFAAIFLIDFIGLVFVLFSKNQAFVKKTVVFLLLLSLIVFSVAFIIYSNKIDVSAKIGLKTIFSLYIGATILFTFLISVIGLKNALKGLIFLLNCGLIAGAVFSTFSIGGQIIYGFDSIYLPKIISSAYTNILDVSISALVSSTISKIIIYAFTAGIALTALNIIYSAISLCGKKIKSFDILRFALVFICFAAVLILLQLKVTSFSLEKSYGLIGLTGGSFLIILFAVSGKVFSKQKSAITENIATTPNLIKEEPVEIKTEENVINNSATQPLTEKQSEKYELPIEEESIKESVEEPLSDYNTEIPEDLVKEYSHKEEPIEVSAKIEIDETPIKPTEYNNVNKPKAEEKAQQLDIETLKKEILADLYLKERTSTLAEDKPKVQPAYEIKEEPEYKPYVNPYQTMNPSTQQFTTQNTQQTAQRNNAYPQSKAPVNPYSKNYFGNQTNDRFFDSLTNEEKEEFDNIFIKKLYGDNKRLPQYLIGGDNREFFGKVFIFIGRYRSIISENLLSKIYLYSTSF